MRIALMGQAAFGADVLKGLIQKGQNVVGVFCPPDRGGKADPLKEAAQAAGLPVFQPGHLRDQEAFEAMTSLDADLGVLAFVTDIVPPGSSTLPGWAPSATILPCCPNTGALRPSTGP